MSFPGSCSWGNDCVDKLKLCRDKIFISCKVPLQCQLWLWLHSFEHMGPIVSESHVLLFATPWTVESMEFSRPEYWSGQPFPSSGDVPNPGIPHCRQILNLLIHKRKPRKLEWVAYPFSSRSSWPRNRTRSPALQVDSLPTELSGKFKVMFFC